MATFLSDREIRKIERDRKKEEDRLKKQNEKQRLQKEDKRTREQSKRDTKERERIELQKQRERLLQERRKLKEKSKLISDMEKRMKEGRRIETDKRQNSSDSDKDFKSDSSETDNDYKEIEKVESDLNRSKEGSERGDESKEKERRKNTNKESISLNRSEYKKRRSRSMERGDNSESEYSDLDKPMEADANVRESFSEERLKDNKGSVQDKVDEVYFREENPLSNDSLGDIDSERELEKGHSESDLSDSSFTTVDEINDEDYFDQPRHNSTDIETEENNNVKYEDEMKWLDEKWQQYESENAELKSNIDKLRNTDREKSSAKSDRDKHVKYTAEEEMLKDKIKRLKIKERKVNSVIQENRLLKQRQAEELEKLKLRQTENKRESDKRRLEKDKLKKLKDEEMLLKQRIEEKEKQLLSENRNKTDKNDNKENTRKANKNDKSESTKGKLHKPNIPSLTETTFEEWKIEVEIILKSGLYEENILRQAIRNSLCGHTRKILLTMSPDATIQQIIYKLESIYGNIRSGESVLSEFYMSKQGKDENVSEWGLRLENILQRAIQKGHIKEEQRDDMLKVRFWRHLYSDDLKNATRLSFETAKSFEELRRKVRIEENEMFVTRIQESETDDKISINQHKGEDDTDIVMKTVLERMKRLEEELLRVQEKSTQEKESSSGDIHRRHDTDQERSKWDRRDRYRGDIVQERSRWDRRDRYRYRYDRYDRGQYRNKYRDYDYGDRRNYKRDYREKYDTEKSDKDYRRRYIDTNWRTEDDTYPRYKTYDTERGYMGDKGDRRPNDRYGSDRGDRRTSDRYGYDRERNYTGYDTNSYRDRNEKYRETENRKYNKEFDRNDREGTSTEQRKQDTDKGDTVKQEHKQAQPNFKPEAASRGNPQNKPLNH